MTSSTFAGLAAILQTQFHVQPGLIQPYATLTDLGLDSLGQLEFVFAVEDVFGLRMALDPGKTRLSLAQLCAVIDGRHGPRAPLAEKA